MSDPSSVDQDDPQGAPLSSGVTYVRGPLVVLEGLPGAGKDQYTAPIASRLKQLLGRDHCGFFRFPESAPPESFFARIIDTVHSRKIQIPTVELAMAYIGVLFQQYIPALAMMQEQRNPVVAHRWWYSTLAFQGCGQPDPEAAIEGFARALRLPQPDLTILFDCPYETYAEQRTHRQLLPVDRAVFEAAAQCYRDLHDRREPGFNPDRSTLLVPHDQPDAVRWTLSEIDRWWDTAQPHYLERETPEDN